jgi:Fic family protein
MTSAERQERHSKGLEPELITDPKKKAEAEALNGLKQYDYAVHAIQEMLERKPFKLRLSLILALHRQALQDISSYAGNFRPAGVEIHGSKHTPPGAHLVPELVEELCDYVNDNWEKCSALHLASYVMWRLNWIHPFSDGNGRTSRILSFVVLSMKIGMVLPGTPTWPELVVDHRADYEDALDAADAEFKSGRIEISKMEAMVGALLAKQLMQVFAAAGGQVLPTAKA